MEPPGLHRRSMNQDKGQQFVLDLLPVSEVVLCCFMAFLAFDGISQGTVRSYLAAMCHLAIDGLSRPIIDSFSPIKLHHERSQVQRGNKLLHEEATSYSRRSGENLCSLVSVTTLL